MNIYARFALLFTLLSVVSSASASGGWGRNDDRYYSDSNHRYERERPETTEEVKTRLLGSYYQESLNQQAKQQQDRAQYEVEKYRLQSEYQLNGGR